MKEGLPTYRVSVRPRGAIGFALDVKAETREHALQRLKMVLPDSDEPIVIRPSRLRKHAGISEIRVYFYPEDLKLADIEPVQIAPGEPALTPDPPL